MNPSTVLPLADAGWPGSGHWHTSALLARAVRRCVAGLQRCVVQLQAGDLVEDRRERLHRWLEIRTYQLNRLMQQVRAGPAWAGLVALPAWQEPVPAAPLLAGLVAAWQLRRPTLSFRLAGPTPLLGADLTIYLAVVVELLLDSAARFAPYGSEVELSSQADPAADVWVFGVRDQGPGLTPQGLAQLLDDPSRAPLNGLGLTLAHSLVSALGGRLWVDSRLGHGTWVKFSVPRQVQVRRWTVPRPRVLVIDNDTELCARLQAELEQAGYEVETAQTAIQGLELARSFAPQLVVLEAVLEPLDGKAMIARLRQQTDAAVVFLTNLRDHEAAAELLWQGAADFIRKPCETRELLARVRAILRRVQAWARPDLRAGLGSLAGLDHSPSPNPLLH